ncbi:hypothetical protein J6590_016297 [Homalodisca vitripennis]|nr:hypothetical protein J6590_016297 [Homalodisca vitripennis]
MEINVFGVDSRPQNRPGEGVDGRGQETIISSSYRPPPATRRTVESQHPRIVICLLHSIQLLQYVTNGHLCAAPEVRTEPQWVKRTHNGRRCRDVSLHQASPRSRPCRLYPQQHVFCD